jgi:hypothetical protein
MSRLVEFEGYFRSEEFVANALGLRKAVSDLQPAYSGSCISELIAKADVLHDVYYPELPSSVENGSRWRILSAVFRRFTWEEIVAFRVRLADSMTDKNGEVAPYLEDRINLDCDLALIQDCILEGKRDVCQLCHCMEGIHWPNGICRVQRNLGPRVVSDYFTR